LTLIDIRGVHKRYGDSVAVAGVDLQVGTGELFGLIGHNGAGKTTLFQHANGLLRPSSGTVFYAGRPLDYGRAGLRELRSRVGLVFQNPDSQLFSASVREDVSFGPMNLGLPRDVVAARVEAALDAVGMAALAERLVHHLSFGQKKRVCIAGVLAMEPELLLLDEPMAGLDQGMQAELLAVLEGLHARGMTILLATHDLEFAYGWADRIHLLAAGRATASLAAAELPGHGPELATAGLAMPPLVAVHQTIADRGLLPAGGPAPRTWADLLARLAPTVSCEERS